MSGCAGFISGGAIVFSPTPARATVVLPGSSTSISVNALTSSSKLTSRSHVALNSFVVLRKSAIVFPIVRAICGSFRGPRNMRAIIPIRMSSDVPMDSRMNNGTTLFHYDQMIFHLSDTSDDGSIGKLSNELSSVCFCQTYQ